MYAFAELEKTVERAVCILLSVVITSSLVLWAMAANSTLQDAISASAVSQERSVVASAMIVQSNRTPT